MTPAERQQRHRAAIPPPPAITRIEREDLLKIVRLRTKVGRNDAKTRAAVLLADFEKQLASVYHWDDSAVWAAVNKRVKDVERAAQAEIAEEARRLGIPDRFAPNIGFAWFDRGENASKERRAELRKVAVTRIELLTRNAFAEIEKTSAEIQTGLYEIGMSSEAAALLKMMPTATQLMPPLMLIDECSCC
jgi:hypothetical protein